MQNNRNWLFIILLIFVGSIMMQVIMVNTPLHKFLPGQLDKNARAEVMQSSLRIDSLERETNIRAAYLQNLIDILSDRVHNDSLPRYDSVAAVYKEELLMASENELAFNARYEEEERFGLSNSKEVSANTPILPVQGHIMLATTEQEAKRGVHIAIDREQPVLAPMEGTVISTAFLVGDGYQIVLQHMGDYVTIFSHLTDIQVEMGQTVKTGVVIGHSGSQKAASDRWVRMQIWLKGKQVDWHLD